MLHLKLLLIIERLLGNYPLCHVSPWWLTLHPSKWSPLGMGFLLGGLLDESSFHSQSYLLFFTLHPFSSPYILGVFGRIDLRRDCISFHAKKGLKA
jgi:hypothetical protein